MLRSLKSELLKLLTIRSTYVITLLFSGLMVLFGFWFEGYKGNTGSSSSKLEPGALTELVANAAGLGSLFLMVIAILYIGHEYRYNTISYSLTSVPNRIKFMASKIAAMFIFTGLYSVYTIGFVFAAYYSGLALRGASLPAQDFSMAESFGKTLFYFVTYALFCMFITVAIRSIVGAFAAIFIFMSTIEPLFGYFILKENAKYLPFSAFNSISQPGAAGANALSYNDGMLVVLAYVAGALLIATVLFWRRDAN